MDSQLLTSTSPSLVQVPRLQDDRLQDGQLPHFASTWTLKKEDRPLIPLGISIL